MATNTEANDDGQYPTAGPHRASYERFRAEWTDDDELLVYDARSESAWIQSAGAISLDRMR